MLKELNDLKKKLVEIQEHINNVYQADISTDDKFSLIFNKDYSHKVFDIFEKMSVEFNYSDYNGSRANDIIRFVEEVNHTINYLEALPEAKNNFTEELTSKEKFLILAEELNLIRDSNLKPKDKYSMIFSENGSRKIFEYLKDVNLDMDYYDPDASYEEDVNAFIDALNDKVKVINKAFKRKL